jgi:glycosyltransferase involved in cell wall biosynthesis
LLTFNEGANIGRTLAKLDWAKDIVVVDSGSTDETLAILKCNPRVRLFERKFDSHPNQWRYAMGGTGIRTSWVLRLDADYQLPDSFIAELALIEPAGAVSAYMAEFDYAVFSQKLIASLYPPKPILLRQGCFAISDEGHTEGWVVQGPVVKLQERVVHDDWKSMREWVVAQARYMTLERDKLQSKRTGVRDWLRMHPPLMPVAVFFYCLLWKRLLFSGKAGLLYTVQRTLAEGILALFILENAIKRNSEAEQGVWHKKKGTGAESAGAGN